MQKPLSLALLLGILFTGCSSLPAKTGPDDCLVVVKEEMINNSKFPPVMTYALHFSSDYPLAYISKESGYLAYVVKEPAVKIVSISGSVQGGFSGGDTNFKLDNLLFPYAPGHIVIFDFVFYQRIEDQGRGLISNYGFRRITDSEKDELIGQIMKNNRGGWEP
jgi:hypothetical protein